MTLFNYLMDNGYVFYDFRNYCWIYLIFFRYILFEFLLKNIGVQTEAWEDYSERANQLISNNITSTNTVFPIIESGNVVLVNQSTTTVQSTSDSLSNVTNSFYLSHL